MAWLLAPISTQDEARAAASEGQATVRSNLAVQPASPSETVSTRSTLPAAVQVRAGYLAVALLRVPALVVQLYASAHGPTSGSLADAAMAMVLPTGGFEATESMFGQPLMVPFT